MHSQTWETRYNPLPHSDDDGSLMHSWDEASGYPDTRVWSVIEEAGRMLVVAGRLPNSETVDYAVTEQPWTTGTERAYWLSLDEEIELGHITRDTANWEQEPCTAAADPHDPCADPHQFPPVGSTVRVLCDIEAREVGEEALHLIRAGQVGTVEGYLGEWHDVHVRFGGQARYVIEGPSGEGTNVHWWSNTDGWVQDRQLASEFTRDERNTLRLPLDGQWTATSTEVWVDPEHLSNAG